METTIETNNDMAALLHLHVVVTHFKFLGSNSVYGNCQIVCGILGSKQRDVHLDLQLHRLRKRNPA